MSSPRITLTYSGSAATTVVDPFWVRLEQEALDDDTATVSDAASLLDAAYQIEPCDQVEDTEAVEPDEEVFAEAVTETIDFAACDYSSNGDIDIQIKVIRSHRAEPYRLRLQGGELVSTETIAKTITISNKVESATSITLDWPVIANFTSVWTAGGWAEVSRVGNTLLFADTADGVVSTSYLTEYDLVTITVLGVDGKPGACTARVFYHGLVDELDCELPTPEEFDQSAYCHPKWVGPPPDKVTCYQTVRIHKLCSCSDVEWDVEEYDQVVECPEDDLRCANNATDCMFFLGTVSVDEYVECPEDKTGTFDSDLSDPEFYLAKCCEQPSVRLPQCSTKKLSWRGGAGIIHGAQHYIDLYGPTTRIVPLMPDGGICGTWTVEQEIMGSNCCDGVEPIEFDMSDTPEVIQSTGTALLVITGGGRHAYTWVVVGEGFSVGRAGLKRIITASPYVPLIANGACGAAHVTVTDGCSVANVAVRSSDGEWALAYQGPGNQYPCVATAGCAESHLGGSAYEGVSGEYKVVQYIIPITTPARLLKSYDAAHADCLSRYAVMIAEEPDFCAVATGRCDACFDGAGYTPCQHYAALSASDPQAVAACDRATFAYTAEAGGGWCWSHVQHASVIYTWVYRWVCGNE